MPCFLSCGIWSFPTWLTLLLQSSKQSQRMCHLMHIIASPWPHFDLFQNGLLPIKAPAKFVRQLFSGFILNSSSWLLFNTCLSSALLLLLPHSPAWKGSITVYIDGPLDAGGRLMLKLWLRQESARLLKSTSLLLTSSLSYFLLHCRRKRWVLVSTYGIQDFAA